MAKASARPARTGAGGGGLSFHARALTLGVAAGFRRPPAVQSTRVAVAPAALRIVDEQTNQTSPRPAILGDARTSSASAVRRSRGMGGPAEQLPGDAGGRGVGGADTRRLAVWRRRPSPTLDRGAALRSPPPPVANGLSPMQSMQYVGQAAAGRSRSPSRLRYADEERGGDRGTLLTCCRMQGIPGLPPCSAR